MMKALVYNGVGKIAVEDRPHPKVQAQTDAVIKMVRTTICGSDLHIIKGHVPSIAAGRVIGHEGIGIIESVGKEVKNFKVGDRVLIACITSCEACHFCKHGSFGLCNTDGGWQLGHLVDGTQAEYIRVPHADAGLYLVPEGADERSCLVLSDILPTALEVGVMRGGVKPGSTVAIIGAGPVGLAAVITAQLYSPSAIVVIDKDENRLKLAMKLGATSTVNPDTAKIGLKAATKAHHAAEKDGFDVVIEAVGVPETFAACQELVGKGGAIANVGVHGTKADLHVETLWSRGIQISMALVDTSTLPMLLKLFQVGKIDASAMITHDFKFADILQAYETFGNAATTGAIKMNIEFASS